MNAEDVKTEYSDVTYYEQRYTYGASYKLMSKYQKLLRKLPLDLQQFMSAQRLCQQIARQGLVSLHRTSTIDNETGEISTFSITTEGVYHCKNSWTCPICSVRLLNKHKHKINRIIMGLAEQRPEQVGIMITVGTPHYKDESIDTIIKRLKGKFKFIRNGNYKRYMKELNSAGSVKNMEVTYTKNGWNLHCHILLFIDKDKLDKIDKWEEYALKRGRQYDNQFLRGTGEEAPPTFYISRNKDNSYRFTKNADYVTANLISRELTYGSNKSVHTETSMQLLDLIDSNDEFYNNLYVDFAIAAHKNHLMRINYGGKICRYMIDNDEYNKRTASKNSHLQIISEVVCSFTEYDWNKINYLTTITGIEYVTDIIQLIANQWNYEEIYKYCYDNRLPTPARAITQSTQKPIAA